MKIPLDKNIIEEDEFVPFVPPFVPSELEVPSFVPVEKTEEIEETSLFPPINDEFERLEPECEESIIIDPLAYYVPYHFNLKLWGIYFRVKEINKDFNNFVNRILYKFKSFQKQFRFLCFLPYIRVIYFHELAHHTIEDVGTMFKYHSTKNYPFLTRTEEEGLCEYMAFKTQLHAMRPFYIPTSLYGIKFNIIPKIHPSPILKKFNEFILSELYYHWNRQNNPVYKPKIYRNVGGKVGPLWYSFWQSHKNHWNVIKIKIPTGKWIEIYKRVFSTNR